MFAHTIMMLAAAVTVTIDPGTCRRVASGRTGAAAWESDGKGHLSVSVDAPSTGDVSLECKVKIPAGATAVTLSFDHAYVSFQPSGSRKEGSGLVFTIDGQPLGDLVRVAGEDWVEARKRSWSHAVQGKSVTVRATAHDVSDRDPVRIDLDGLKVTFEAAAPASTSAGGPQR